MRSERLLLIGAGALLIGVVAVGLWYTLLQPAQATPARAVPGAAAPQIALPIVGGGTSNLAADRGKVVLVNFWATWCEPCKSEMPALQHLADRLHGQSFALYSVDLQEDGPRVEAFQRQYNLNLYALLDEDGDLTRTYGVRALPSTFLIDKSGVLREQRLGELLAGGADTTWSEAWLEDQVHSLLSTSS
jgi:thiol-disulfide isomerase/thioredoxin